MSYSITTVASAKTFLLGAVGGALIATYLGFSWGGWMLGSTAYDMAEKQARESKAQAFATICVDKFLHQADAAMQLEDLKKLSSYDQKSFVQKGGFAEALGTKDDLSAVSGACATSLSTLSAKDVP
jgi:flagellar motor component MotA